MSILLTDTLANDEAIFRSAPMTLVQFYVTIELARDLVYALGCVGNVHFRDLNSKLTAFQRTFIDDLRNIDGIQANLSFIHGVMTKFNTANPNHFLDTTIPIPLPSSSDLDVIKQRIADFHEKIKHLVESYDDLSMEMMKFIENRYVLTAYQEFYHQSLEFALAQPDVTILAMEESEGLLNRLEEALPQGEDGDETREHEEIDSRNSIAGTIDREKIHLLRNILWRTLRGNLYFNDIPITQEKLSDFNQKDPKLVDKSVFIIYTHGDFLKSRVRKIIQSLDGKIYDNVIGSRSIRNETLEEVNQKITDLSLIVESTKSHLITELLVFQENYHTYSYTIQRERLIYETLNQFDEDSTRRCLVGEGWIPKSEFDNVNRTLKNLIRQRSHIGSGSSTSSLVSQDSSIPIFTIDDTDTGIINYGGTNDDQDNLVAVVNELTTNRVPPTYHKINKFTGAFQLIIDAYGIATYQEVNPGLATIITFPFMFAIMFGDLGHGFIVFLVSLYLIRNEIQFGAMRNKDEIFEMAFNGRYIILLMGGFSMYTGLIYNDVFSKSMSLFGSAWKWEFPEGYDFSRDGPISLTAQKIAGKTYLLGIDWGWHGAENNLLFTNSYKMKLSILMGFIHMNYSLFFSLINYRFFKSRVDIIGNFIPGFLFMQSIFGYLTLTIVYKWCVDWLGSGKQPPGLLNMLINMFLAPGKIEEQLYPGQKFVQIVLVLIAAICVPWLLLYKPIVLNRENNKAKRLGYTDLHSQAHHTLQMYEEEAALVDTDLSGDPHEHDEIDMLDDDYRFPNDIEPLNINSGDHGGDGEHGGFNLGDVVIHQVIHTIEFCLNCVSHTASYLRLWALSLAHAQLSSVLWSMTIQNAFGVYGTTGVIMTVLLFGLWFILTVCILVLMEGTSAMLHSLRLHWVEAMSKFFQGEGYAYEPFTFTGIE
jgi:V-type H+-transporting ATPase subunit a